MKNVKALSLACALAAAAVPITAAAVTERVVLEACASAALAELPGFDSEVTTYRLDPSSEHSDRRRTSSESEEKGAAKEAEESAEAEAAPVEAAPVEAVAAEETETKPEAGE